MPPLRHCVEVFLATDATFVRASRLSHSVTVDECDESTESMKPLPVGEETPTPRILVAAKRFFSDPSTFCNSCRYNTPLEELKIW